MKVNYKTSWFKDLMVTIFIIMIMCFSSNIYFYSKNFEVTYHKLQEIDSNFNTSFNRYQKSGLNFKKYNTEDGIVGIYAPVPIINFY